MIFKHEILVSENRYDKITPNEINELYNIFNYMFKQGFNDLLNRCHDVLWKIANYKRINDIILVIYFKSAISWQLSDNIERLEKYNVLFNEIDFSTNET